MMRGFLTRDTTVERFTDALVLAVGPGVTQRPRPSLREEPRRSSDKQGPRAMCAAKSSGLVLLMSADVMQAIRESSAVRIGVRPAGEVGCGCNGVDRDNKGGRQRVGGEAGKVSGRGDRAAGLGGERHVVGGESRNRAALSAYTELTPSVNTLFFLNRCLCASEYQHSY